MYISVSCFTRYESFAKSSLKIASEQELFIPRGCQILAPKRSLAFLGFSGFSLSGSWRLKAIRGSHAPAVRHLSLHLFLSSSSSSSSTSHWLYSLSLLRAWCARYSVTLPRPTRIPSYRVNRERDAHWRQ